MDRALDRALSIDKIADSREKMWDCYKHVKPQASQSTSLEPDESGCIVQCCVASYDIPAADEEREVMTTISAMDLADVIYDTGTGIMEKIYMPRPAGALEFTEHDWAFSGALAYNISRVRLTSKLVPCLRSGAKCAWICIIFRQMRVLRWAVHVWR